MCSCYQSVRDSVQVSRLRILQTLLLSRHHAAAPMRPRLPSNGVPVCCAGSRAKTSDHVLQAWLRVLLDHSQVAFLPFLQNSLTLLKVASVRRRRSGSSMSTLLHLPRPFELGSPSHVVAISAWELCAIYTSEICQWLWGSS